MSMGIPVIMSETRFNKLILDEYPFGIAVTPGNIDEITSAIKYLKSNPEKAYEMGMNGRKAIREKFNWELEEKKLIDLYKSL